MSRFDLFYRAYVSGIFVVAGIAVMHATLRGSRLSPAEASEAYRSVLLTFGVATAGALAIGVRLGTQGGPIPIERADLQQLLLAPVDRATALTTPTLARLRAAAARGGAVGLLGGLLGAERLGGGAPAWLLSGGVAGAAFGVLPFVTALLVATSHRARMAVWGAVAMVAAWSVLDLATSEPTSPGAVLGRVAMSPARPAASSVVAPIGIGAAALWAITRRGALPLEAARRRTRLAAILRFSAAIGDIRAVVLAQRELSQDHPRPRPWIAFAIRENPRLPAARRDLRGILRWPAQRLARVAVLGVVVGSSLVAIARGTTLAVALAAAGVWLVGLEATEGLAQETDHPEVLAGLPRRRGPILATHLLAPLMVTLVAASLAAAVLVAAERSAFAATIGAATAVAIAVSAVAAGAVTAMRGPPELFNPADLAFPELAGGRVVATALLPAATASLGCLPIFFARESLGPAPTVATSAAVVVIVGARTVSWLLWRDEYRAWLDRSPLGFLRR